MGDVIEFPGNRTSETFERYIGRCGQPSPITGEPCVEPAGHATAHLTEASAGGNCLGWPL